MTERPELHEIGSATAVHSQVRYAFASRISAGKRVLDIACGNGIGTAQIADVAGSVIGVDASEDAIQTARRMFARPNIEYECIRSGRLPFPDAEFDLVVCLETIEHLRRELQASFLTELQRVTKADGILVISTPDRDAERRYELATGGFNPWHAHTPTEKELDAALGEFPNRALFYMADFIATVICTEGSLQQPSYEGLPTVRAAFSRIRVCARAPEPLRNAVARLSTRPIELRKEPRLHSVDLEMDRLPFRLRWAELPSEQSARTEAGIASHRRPGSAAWWQRAAAYAFIAQLAGDRRVADVGCGTGGGAARLARGGAEVIASEAPGIALDVARNTHGSDRIRFVASQSLLPDEDGFDVAVCLTGDRKTAVERELAVETLSRLNPDGVLVTDVPVSGARSIPLFVGNFVATTVLDDDGGIVGGFGDHGQLPELTPTATLHAVVRSEASAQRVLSAAPVVLLRGDFQWEALVTEILLSDRLPDLAGFAPAARDEILAVLIARLHTRIREHEQTSAALSEALAGELRMVSDHSVMLRLRGLAGRVKQSLHRAD